MRQISLSRVVPEVFADKEEVISEVWQTDRFLLEKGTGYLIEAGSGTGKSSLCSYIYGYRNDYRGTICFDDEDIRTFSATRWDGLRKTSVSMLFQELRLFPELSVMENICLKNNLSRGGTNQEGFHDRAWITRSLEMLGIAMKTDALVGQLSYGQQQRVALIRALCQPFDFIFLDEPVSHLDDANGSLVAQLLMEEAGRQGAGVIITSIGKHPEVQFDKIMRL